jgi:hypothetical protein
VSLLEKAGCKHAKVVIQPDFVLSAEDVKDPSAEAISLGGKFYYEVWLNGGREIADEVIRRNEEEVISISKPLLFASASYYPRLSYSYFFLRLIRLKKKLRKLKKLRSLNDAYVCVFTFNLSPCYFLHSSSSH